jgi:N-dimethylarginine dimethylaminohydrolase
VSLVDRHVGPVELLTAEPWASAMTFVRDLGLSTAAGVVPLMPGGHRAPFEVPLFAKTLRQLGEATLGGDALPIAGGNVLADAHGRLLIGVSDDVPGDDLRSAVACLEAATRRTAYRVPIAGGRFPHIDMALCDLDGRGWLAYPAALGGFDLSRRSWQELFRGLPVIVVDPPDGERLACNLVIGDGVVIGPPIGSTLVAEIAALGIEHVATPLDELLKAGGGAHCLTLELR